MYNRFINSRVKIELPFLKSGGSRKRARSPTKERAESSSSTSKTPRKTIRKPAKPQQQSSVYSSIPSMVSDGMGGYSEELLDRLNQLKSELCEEERRYDKSIMPYHILTANVLEEIAKSRPTSLAELGGVEGLPKAKVEKYGSKILEVIREYESTQAPPTPK